MKGGFSSRSSTKKTKNLLSVFLCSVTFEGESAQAEYKNGKITLEMDGDKVIFEKK